jgi:hypothetical protein
MYASPMRWRSNVCIADTSRDANVGDTYSPDPSVLPQYSLQLWQELAGAFAFGDHRLDDLSSFLVVNNYLSCCGCQSVSCFKLQLF